MKFFQNLQDIAIVVIGVLSMMMIFMPIFSGNNMWSFIKQALESGYKFQVFEFLSFNENDNMLSLIKPLSEYVKIQDKMINPSLFVFLYELIVFVLSLLIVLLGAVLLFIGVKNLVFKHGFKYYKVLISIVMAFSLVLIFVLGCFGIGPIILSIFSFLTLILFYVSDIVSKEKRFVLRHLIHKSICAILLFLLLSFSSFGLVKLNAELGVNLYSFAPYPVSGDISAPIYFSCKGIFYEFMQFIQCSSGDDMFTSISFAFCLLTFIAHFLYITFIVIAICNLIRGLSPIPGCNAILDGNEIKIYNSIIGNNKFTNKECGEICLVSKEGISVCTGDGEIIITELKPFGKKRMDAYSYVNGVGKDKLIGKVFK